MRKKEIHQHKLYIKWFHSHWTYHGCEEAKNNAKKRNHRSISNGNRKGRWPSVFIYILYRLFTFHNIQHGVDLSDAMCIYEIIECARTHTHTQTRPSIWMAVQGWMKDQRCLNYLCQNHDCDKFVCEAPPLSTSCAGGTCRTVECDFQLKLIMAECREKTCVPVRFVRWHLTNSIFMCGRQIGWHRCCSNSNGVTNHAIHRAAECRSIFLRDTAICLAHQKHWAWLLSACAVRGGGVSVPASGIS